jgi:hypothetical protein
MKCPQLPALGMGAQPLDPGRRRRRSPDARVALAFGDLDCDQG